MYNLNRYSPLIYVLIDLYQNFVISENIVYTNIIFYFLMYFIIPTMPDTGRLGDALIMCFCSIKTIVFNRITSLCHSVTI